LDSRSRNINCLCRPTNIRYSLVTTNNSYDDDDDDDDGTPLHDDYVKDSFTDS